MIPILEFIAGCAILAFGADRFLRASIVIAERFKMPSIMVGVLLVGFGTSFSETVVAVVAAMHGKSIMAVGNVVGSNVANMGLVLGIAALIRPVIVHSQFIKRELPVLLGVTVFAGLLLYGGFLSRLDGVLLLCVLLLHIVMLFIKAPRDRVLQVESQDLPIEKERMSFRLALFFWPLGLLALYISSELIVSGATQIALWLHVSELVIGITVVAVGTSLPELATIVMSTLRKQPDIAIGSVIGSNIFNTLAVLAMPALIAPTYLPPHFVTRDYLLMAIFTFLFYGCSRWPKKERNISRFEGGLLLIAYIAYMSVVVVFSG